nr:MAG TPA: portal protein [Caudoviricetes sp.]
MPTLQEILKKYDKAYNFNQAINLYDTVKVNEDYFIGNQWEGVQSNGLPTPTYNMFKRVINFQVSNITSDSMAIQVSTLPGVSKYSSKDLDDICVTVNKQVKAIMEQCKIISKNREFLRNAAVTGDGCIHFYFDPSIENGQDVKGEICAEVLDNVRVLFGNPNTKDVQKQPHIILVRRELVNDVRYKMETAREDSEEGAVTDDAETIQPDSEKFQNKYDSYTDDKVTVLTYYFRNRETETIWVAEATEQVLVSKPHDTGMKYYPLVWLNWDYVRDCYHGQAMVTGLLPNQNFINKMFALVGISLLTSAFPKYIYDKTKVSSWSGDVGTAIGVSGNVDGVAKVIEGASISPQIAQFIEMSFDKTHTLLGASDVAMGDSRPDNTSAIIALQRAASTPMEMTKQQDYQCMEDACRIWIDMMSVYYGTRMVEQEIEMDAAGQQPLGMDIPPQKGTVPFDFSVLRSVRLAVKIDVGTSSYWSEIATMQTLDNLLMNRFINLIQYLERMPAGYMPKQQELIDELKTQSGMQPAAPQGTGMSTDTTSSADIAPEGGPGNGALQRAINREGA